MFSHLKEYILSWLLLTECGNPNSCHGSAGLCANDTCSPSEAIQSASHSSSKQSDLRAGKMRADVMGKTHGKQYGNVVPLESKSPSEENI